MAGTHLRKRGNTWYTNKRVPLELANAAGKTHIVLSTGTGDKREAERRAITIIATELRRLETLAAALGEPTESPAWLRRQAAALRAAVNAGELDEETASDLLGLLTDRHVQATGARLNDKGHPELPERHVAAIRSSHEYLSDPTATPLSDAIKAYLEEKDGRVEASTLHKKRRTLENFADWMKGDPLMKTIGKPDAGRYASHLLSLGRSFSTNKDVVGMLSAFWSWCIRKGYTDHANPWPDQIEDLRPSRRGNVATAAERRPWTRDELLSLVTALDADDVRLHLCVLAAYTGMRLNEICSMKTADVNLDADFLAVSEGKTKSSVRQVPLHPTIKPLVKRLVESSTDGYLIAGLEEGGLDSKRGSAVSKRIGRLIRKVVTKDQAVVFHSLRNTFINACETAGVPEASTKLLVGHSRQSLTYGLYSAGLDLPVLREAVLKVTHGPVDDAVSAKLT
jgi:integrase